MNGSWEKKKDRFKLKFSGITDKDLEYSEGYENKMLEKLGSKLGKSEMDLLCIIIEF